MFQRLHTSSSVLHTKCTVNTQIIWGLLQCYSIIKKKTFKNFYFKKSYFHFKKVIYGMFKKSKWLPYKLTISIVFQIIESQLCHIVNAIHLPFNQGCFKGRKFKTTWIVKTDNKFKVWKNLGIFYWFFSTNF